MGCRRFGKQFVQDKLDAVFQRWQTERYAATAVQIMTATVLVAPRVFIARNGSSALCGKTVSIEDIATWLRGTKDGRAGARWSASSGGPSAVN